MYSLNVAFLSTFIEIKKCKCIFYNEQQKKKPKLQLVKLAYKEKMPRGCVRLAHESLKSNDLKQQNYQARNKKKKKKLATSIKSMETFFFCLPSINEWKDDDNKIKNSNNKIENTFDRELHLDMWSHNVNEIENLALLGLRCIFLL